MALHEMSCYPSLYWDTNIVHLLKPLQVPSLSLALLPTYTRSPPVLYNIISQDLNSGFSLPKGPEIEEVSTQWGTFCLKGNEWWRWLEQTHSSFILFCGLIEGTVPFQMLSLAPVWVNMSSEQICVSGFHFGAAPCMVGTQIALFCLLLFSLFPFLSFSRPELVPPK